MKSPHALSREGNGVSPRKRRRSPPPLQPTAEISNDLRDDAEALVTVRLGLEKHSEIHPKVMIERLLTHRTAQEKMSREEHLQKLADAYATYAYLSAKPEFCAHILEKIIKELSISIRKDTDPLRIVVQSFIAYGSGDAKERDRATRLYSRDVCAIRYLISQDVYPSEVVELAKGSDEGLDKWSRRAPRKRNDTASKKITPRSFSELIDETTVIEIRTEKGGAKATLEIPASVRAAAHLALRMIHYISSSPSGSTRTPNTNLLLKKHDVALGPKSVLKSK